MRESFENQQTQERYPIDFVVTWVDGNDPIGKKRKQNIIQIKMQIIETYVFVTGIICNIGFVL